MRHCVTVSDAELEDLRARIKAARWRLRRRPLRTSWQPAGKHRWSSLGTGREEYDWRKAEAKLKALPIRHRDRWAGHPLHPRPPLPASRNALPLIVTHGSPGSVIEQAEVINPLVNPTAHGGADASSS